MKCSFCNKDQRAVITLIITPDNKTGICNECVDVCNETMKTPTIDNETHFDMSEQTVYSATFRNYEVDYIKEIIDWAESNFDSVWVKKYTETASANDSYKLIFENESDLIALKLRWI